MQKILLLSLNSKYIHSSLAVWYLRASVDKISDAQVMQRTINEDVQAIIHDIIEERPDVLGVSCYIWNMNVVKKIIPQIRQCLPHAIIVLGGPEVSFNVQDVLREIPSVDYVISGEGERPFYEFVRALSKNSIDICEIDGLCYRGNIRPPHRSKDDPPSPYTEHYFRDLNARIAYMESSRGCPFSCSYCLSGAVGNVRFFDIERVKRDIDLLSKSGTQTIKFIDRTFNCNEKHASDIIRHIIAKNPVYDGVRYHFEMAGDIMTQDFVRLLCSAPKGLFQIEVGVQSFNEKTLEAVNRKTNFERLLSNLTEIIASQNVHVHVDLIAGLPFESFDSFALGVDTLLMLSPHMIQLGVLKLLHGSTLEKQNYGTFSKNPPYEVLHTPWISEQELGCIDAVEDILDRLYNSGYFASLLFAYVKHNGNLFSFLLYVGRECKHIPRKNIDEFCETILRCFSPKVPYARDIMKEGWLAKNASGRLPLCLRDTYSEAEKRIVRELKSQSFGIKRGICFLREKGEVIYADYDKKDEVTGRYTVHRQNIHVE